jgi:hypothetical protein
MTEFNSVDELAKIFFTINQYGFDDWVVIKISEIESEKKTLVTLANPISNDLEQVVISNYKHQEIESFRNSYRKHYLKQLEDRFGFYLPFKNSGDVEYETFDLFKQYWIEEEGKNYLPFNIPLLFDFPNNLQYAEALQDKTIAVNYQRLIALVAQPRKKRIKTLFIKNVKEEDIESIRLLILQKANDVSEELFK